MTDRFKARDLLESGDYTCVLQKGEVSYTSKERGVKPLFDWLESSVDLRGFSAADRVVGKGPMVGQRDGVVARGLVDGGNLLGGPVTVGEGGVCRKCRKVK